MRKFLSSILSRPSSGSSRLAYFPRLFELERREFPGDTIGGLLLSQFGQTAAPGQVAETSQGIGVAVVSHRDTATAFHQNPPAPIHASNSKVASTLLIVPTRTAPQPGSQALVSPTDAVTPGLLDSKNWWDVASQTQRDSSKTVGSDSIIGIDTAASTARGNVGFAVAVNTDATILSETAGSQSHFVPIDSGPKSDVPFIPPLATIRMTNPKSDNFSQHASRASFGRPAQGRSRVDVSAFDPSGPTTNWGQPRGPSVVPGLSTQLYSVWITFNAPSGDVTGVAWSSGPNSAPESPTGWRDDYWTAYDHTVIMWDLVDFQNVPTVGGVECDFTTNVDNFTRVAQGEVTTIQINVGPANFNRNNRAQSATSQDPTPNSYLVQDPTAAAPWQHWRGDDTQWFVANNQRQPKAPEPRILMPSGVVAPDGSGLNAFTGSTQVTLVAPSGWEWEIPQIWVGYVQQVVDIGGATYAPAGTRTVIKAAKFGLDWVPAWSTINGWNSAKYGNGWPWYITTTNRSL